MQLTYRGSKYQGLDWNFRNLKKSPTQQPSLELKYRGVAYRTHEASQPNKAPVVAATSVEPVKVSGLSTEDKARTRMLQQNHLIKNRQQALLSRSAAEVGLTNLNDYWNHIQGSIHPTFRRNYERSHVSLS